MSDVQITIVQLPAAGPITGTESVPIVQNGQTVQTTTAAIAASPSQFQTFLTVNQEPTLPNSRRLTTQTGLGLTDNGPLSTYSLALNGASGSLETASDGIVAKTGSTTVTGRTLTASGLGISITDGNGVSGNPTFSLSGLPLSLANIASNGILTSNSGSVNVRVLQGTANQVDVANGNAVAGNPTFSIASNPIIPGTGAMRVPVGTAAQQPVGTDGEFRFNSDTQTFDGYSAGQWRTFSVAAGVTSFSAGATGFSPVIPTIGGIVLSGTLNPASGGTGVNNGLFTTTLNGNVSFGGAVSTGGAVTTGGAFTTSGAFGITLTATGNTSVTLPTSGTLATLAGSEALTNKTMSGALNTFSNIPNAALDNSSISFTYSGGISGSASVSLGSSNALSLSNIPNSSLQNSSLTVGTTSIALGASSLTLGGLTSVEVTQDPTSALQLATKQYVDGVAQGLNVKASVAWGTTADISLSGLSTQVGGEWTGTLTAGDRILVKNQSTQADNGIYAASSGIWTRTADANTWDELVSAFVFVQQGSTLGDTGWVCTINPGGTLGVTAVTWSQFSGAGTYTAGTGLTLVGSQFSLTSPVTAALGGTGQTSYATGDILYASAATTLSKLTLGTSGQVLTAGASAPQYVNQSTLAVGSATDATNTGITASTTNATHYLTFVTATTGNLPQLVNSGITCNPSTGQVTGGVAGGAF